MAGYKYQAIDTEGRVQTGVLEEDSLRQARLALRERGLIPLNVNSLAATPTQQSVVGGLRRRLSGGELVLITRQFATLAEAGLTVEEILNTLIEQAESDYLRHFLASVRGEVLAGQTLARAFAKFPNIFPEFYRTLVDAGERSGQLDKVMLRLADYTEARLALRQKVGLAFIYPGIVTVVALAVVAGLLTYVVPQVIGVFENSQQTLPLLTRGLLALSDFLVRYGIILLAAILLAGWLGRRLLQLPANRFAFHLLLLRLPLAGRLLRTVNTARLSSTLAILVDSGVPLLVALEASIGVVNNLPMQNALKDAQRRVQEGGSLSRALAASKMFPPIMINLIASGEASGQLGDMLARIARQQTQQLETQVSTLTGILEPVMILIMGVIVLIIVLAILLPIFELNQLVR